MDYEAQEPESEPATGLVPAEEGAGFTSIRVLRFANAYLKTGNAMEAARRAGYQGSDDALRKAAARLLRREDVSTFVSTHLSALMSPEEAGAIVSDLARCDISNFIDIDDEGNPVLNLLKAEAQSHMRQIQALKPTKYGWEIRLHNPVEPLKLYAQYRELADRKRQQRQLLEGLLSQLSPQMRDLVRADLAKDGTGELLLDVAVEPGPGPSAEVGGEVDLSWLRAAPDGFPVESPADEDPS